MPILATFLTEAEAHAYCDTLAFFAFIERDIFSGRFNVLDPS